MINRAADMSKGKHMYALMGREAEKQCGTSVESLAKDSLRHCEWEVMMEYGSSTIDVYEVGKE